MERHQAPLHSDPTTASTYAKDERKQEDIDRPGTMDRSARINRHKWSDLTRHLRVLLFLVLIGQIRRPMTIYAISRIRPGPGFALPPCPYVRVPPRDGWRLAGGCPAAAAAS